MIILKHYLEGAYRVFTDNVIMYSSKKVTLTIEFIEGDIAKEI